METIFYSKNWKLDFSGLPEVTPIIVSICGVEYGQPSLGLNYQRAIEQAGGQLVVIGWDNVEQDLEAIKPHGLLLPGGAFKTPDIWYGIQGGNDQISPRCGAYLDAIAYAKKHHLPTLGICAGMQLMAVEEGYQLAILENPQALHKAPRTRAAHKVKIEKHSLLFDILPEYLHYLTVNSRHSEFVLSKEQDCNTGWPIAYCENDGHIEAMEFNWADFALAVQWHPEDLAVLSDCSLSFMMEEQVVKASKNIFNAFILAAKDYKGYKS